MLDDTQMWHQQQQEHQQWSEREYDITFGSFAIDFKKFVESYKNATQQALAVTDSRPITAD